LINDDVNREFVHSPEPLPENLGQLCEAVKSAGADIGFAIDPDADRLALIDGTGRPIGEERTLPICMSFALTRAAKGGSNGQNVVVNLSSTQALDDVASKSGANIVRTPIGEAHVVKAITEKKALIGGEGNGGVIFPAVHSGRDAATGIALVLSAMAHGNMSLAELNSQIPDYAMVKLRHDGAVKDSDRLLARMREAFPTAKEIVTIDGVKVLFGDRWVHVRPSGTEPIVRVFSEAPTQSEAEALANEAMSVLRES
jgi:phosphomannomutase